MVESQIKIDVPDKLLPYFESNYRYNVIYGGRGGSKSWTIALRLVTKAMNDKRLILCTREVQNTIKDSVHRLLSDTIEKYQWDNIFNVKRDEIVCKRTGSNFIFKGLSRNIWEIKSTEGIDDCWIEEAHSISRESLDILIPTVRKENSQFWITYNPDNDDDPVHHDFVIKGRPDAFVTKINYDENPFFPEVLRKEMEYDKKYNYDKYLHVWEGNTKSITDACIFKDKFTVQNFETSDNVHFYFGADWGFSNNPTVLIRCYVEDDYLWVDQEASGVGVELDEIEQLFDSIEESRCNKIIADNQRPDTISYLKRKGFIIKPCAKGQGSVEDGIEFMKKFKKIIIHERCKNAIYEFKSYSYKKDKHTDEILPIIIDKDNHVIDSIRYALEDMRKGLGRIKASKVSAGELGL